MHRSPPSAELRTAFQYRCAFWVLLISVLLVTIGYRYLLPPIPEPDATEARTRALAPRNRQRPPVSDAAAVAQRLHFFERAESRREEVTFVQETALTEPESAPRVQVPPPVLIAAASPLLPVGFTNYTEKIPGTSAGFELVAITGGEAILGSPEDEPGRNKNDLARHKVFVNSFWMGKYEVGWPEFLPWVNPDRRELGADRAEGIRHPTKPAGSIFRGRGEKGYPAIGMSQEAAVQFCKWLSKKTGHHYRLPTEAEWEYACRARGTTAYYWSDDPFRAEEYAWFNVNSQGTTHPAGRKQLNGFGLYDMAGNVGEWCAKSSPNDPNVLRGGAFSDPVTGLRSAARALETPEWNPPDNQNPPDNWWLAAADFAGFRVVRSLDDNTPPMAAPQGKASALADFRTYCAACHGTDGRGQTKLGRSSDTLDLTAPAVKASLTSQSILRAIRYGLTKAGHKVMPSYAVKLTDSEITSLAELVANL
jgi:formylglycine-generating enzyme required for sulfatase activity